MSENDSIQIREATEGDWGFLLAWRNDPETREASRNTKPVSEMDHREWLRKSVASESRKLLIAELDSHPVGTVRLDFDGHECEVSWTVAPNFRGRGIGIRMVSNVVQTVALPMRAVARGGNIGSRKIAEAAGFEASEDDGEWVTLRRGPGRASD